MCPEPFQTDKGARFRELTHIQERNRTVVHLQCEIQSLRFYLRMPKFRPDPHLPPFPARTSHALLPLCPSEESPCNTSSAAENYIIVKPAPGSHCPAISRRRGRVAAKRKTPNTTAFPGQVVLGLTTLWSSGNTPGTAYGAQANIQNPGRRKTFNK